MNQEETKQAYQRKPPTEMRNKELDDYYFELGECYYDALVARDWQTIYSLQNDLHEAREEIWMRMRYKLYKFKNLKVYGQ